MSDNITQEEKFASVFTHPNDQNGGINEGKKYDPTDCLYAEDVNKIVQNEVFLYEKVTLYRHRVRASGSATSGSITHYAAAYIDVYTRSDTAISSARNLAEALSISYGGTKNVPASGYRENGATHTVLCTEATVTADTSSDVSNASVTLHGMYFGCDNYNDGYIERVTVAATEFSDEVTAV